MTKKKLIKLKIGDKVLIHHTDLQNNMPAKVTRKMDWTIFYS
jgi:hypothetical protein